MVRIGIVGLPNVGKSTIFNGLCGAQAKVSNYAFCTVEPNRAVVPVPDPRLDRVAEIFGQERAVPVTATFVDIAGLVRGASKGEGLGNQFLAHIREVDAIIHVVRCFSDPEVAHVEDGVDASRDVEIVDIELALADLGTVQRRLDEVRADAKSGDPEARAQAAFLERLSEHLNQGRPARMLALSEAERDLVGELHLLTARPELYVANVGEDAKASQPCADALADCAERRGSQALVVSGKVQAELAELPAEERGQFAGEMGVSMDALDQVVAASYRVLNLVTFFTAVGKEARAWSVPKGTTIAEAAGRIHSDMENGFVRAEVTSYEALDRAGSWEAAHREGLIRIEGRSYLVQDGDIVHVRFTPAGR
jgi:GTP-binding protein YchF